MLCFLDPYAIVRPTGILWHHLRRRVRSFLDGKIILREPPGCSSPFESAITDPFSPQAIGPLCVEVAGLKNLQSLLSLSWATIILPTTCKYGFRGARLWCPYRLTFCKSPRSLRSKLGVQMRTDRTFSRSYLSVSPTSALV